MGTLSKNLPNPKHKFLTLGINIEQDFCHNHTIEPCVCDKFYSFWPHEVCMDPLKDPGLKREIVDSFA